MPWHLRKSNRNSKRDLSCSIPHMEKEVIACAMQGKPTCYNEIGNESFDTFPIPQFLRLA